MKKLISILLVLAMVLSMSAMAFAATSPTVDNTEKEATATKADGTTVAVEVADTSKTDATYKEVQSAGSTEAFVEKQSAAVQEEVKEALKEQSLAAAPVEVKDLEVAAVKNVEVKAAATEEVTVNIPVAGTKRTDAVVVVATSKTGEKSVAAADVTANGVVSAELKGDTKTAVVMTAPRFTDENKVDTKAYTDIVKDAWYADNMSWAVGNGLLEGKSETKMDPDASVTFEQACTIFQRAAGVQATTYEAAVAWASEDGTSTGVAKASTSAELSRADVIMMLYQFAGKPAVNGNSTFKDAAEIPANLQAAFAWAQAMGILEGFGDGTVRPLSTLTRAQISAIIERYAK